MKLPIPPAWRAFGRSSSMPWALAAVVAAVAGAGWLLNPGDAATGVRDARRRLVGRQPNATGHTLGYGAGIFASPIIDPLEVLANRAAIARQGSNAPTYRGGASEFFRPYLPSPPEVTWPMPQQNLRALGAQAPYRGVPSQADAGVSITAAQVLAEQRGAS